jgi:hypothetical protein
MCLSPSDLPILHPRLNSSIISRADYEAPRYTRFDFLMTITGEIIVSFDVTQYQNMLFYPEN